MIAIGEATTPNTAAGNGRHGIFAVAFSAPNAFVANHMLGNTIHHAHDDATSSSVPSTWRANHCATDWPVDAICLD